MKSFLTIRQTAKVTGLSEYYLRVAVKTGTVKGIKSGNRFLINLPALMKDLGVECGEK